ncbi:MAG TPA: hypothetical protein VNU97_17225 [Rhizomicrobium sp.]|jgi:hypothetical protein|nr:hypothetical protein [Rhizomicrobium sp.]
MDEDDLPPPKPAESEDSFSGELGRTFAGFVWVAVFVAIAGAVLFAAMRWL